jgi:hypothetical protein
MRLPADMSRCAGRTGFASDDQLCPRRASCLRHTDIPKDGPHLFSIVMHMCVRGDDAFIPNGESDDGLLRCSRPGDSVIPA